MKEAEEKLSLYTAGSSSTFVAATVARTPSTTLTPNLTPTPLPSRIVDVHADPSPSTTVANVASTSRVVSSTPNDAVEYIDAADANEYIMYLQNALTYDYIVSLPGVKFGNKSLGGEPYLSRWPNEWTEKVDALKKNNRDGWKEHASMMNCMKMFGLGITRENCLFVRDHRSRGCPQIFWMYNKCKSVEDVHWEVGTSDDVNVAGRVLKKPNPLGDNDGDGESSSPHSLALHPFNPYKQMLQECLVVAGVDDHSSLIIALKKYKNQDLRLEEVAYADEELTEHQLKEKELKEKKKQAMEGLISTNPRFGCVRNKHKDNKRQRWKKKKKKTTPVALFRFA